MLFSLGNGYPYDGVLFSNKEQAMDTWNNLDEFQRTILNNKANLKRLCTISHLYNILEITNFEDEEWISSFQGQARDIGGGIVCVELCVCLWKKGSRRDTCKDGNVLNYDSWLLYLDWYSIIISQDVTFLVNWDKHIAKSVLFLVHVNI